MKKLILLLITLITLINVSYASFPVFESDSLVIEEMEPLTENFSGNSLYPILSLLFSLFGYFMVVITFAAAYGGNNEIPFLIITLISMLAAVILGLIGLSKKKYFSVIGFLLGLLGLLMVLGSS